MTSPGEVLIWTRVTSSGAAGSDFFSVSLARPKSSTFTRPSFREHDVFGFDVTVHNSGVVRGIERRSDLQSDVQSVTRRDGGSPLVDHAGFGL